MKNKTKFIAYSIGLAALLFVFTPLVLILSSIVYVYTGPEILSIAILPAYAIVAGYLFSRIFRGYDSSKVIISGVLGSVVFAGISGIQKVIYDSLNSIMRNASSMEGSLGSIPSQGMVDPDLYFIVLMISFNSPIIYSLIKREELEPKYLILYALPVLFYLAIPAVFSGII